MKYYLTAQVEFESNLPPTIRRKHSTFEGAYAEAKTLSNGCVIEADFPEVGDALYKPVEDNA